MGFFGDLFSNDPAKDAAAKSTAIRNEGLATATNTLNTGYGKASEYLDTASGRFDPLATTANQGYGAYANLLGIGGGDPTAAVRAMPGYQFSQNEGREQVLRGALGNGATGIQSGNTLQSIFDRGANIADTKWQTYADALKPFLSLAPQIAGQQGTYDTQQAGLQTGLAGTLAGYQTGTAGANADAAASAELARASAAKNVFDAVMGGAKLAVGAFTGGPGGGASPATNFANMFK